MCRQFTKILREYFIDRYFTVCLRGDAKVWNEEIDEICIEKYNFNNHILRNNYNLMSEIKEMADHFLLGRRLNLSDSSKQQWPHVYGHRYIVYLS